MNTRTIPAYALHALKRNFSFTTGIYANHVSVRSDVPWHMRVLGILGIITYSLVLATFFYQAGQRAAGMDSKVEEAASLRTSRLNAELEQVRKELHASQAVVDIERAAQRTLARQSALLAEESARLKEELAVLRHVSTIRGPLASDKPVAASQPAASLQGTLPVPTVPAETVSSGGIRLDNLRVSPAAAKGMYHYSFLIEMQGARRGKENRFDLEIALMTRGNRPGEILPGAGAQTPREPVVIRNYRTIRGMFTLPAGSEASDVEIRLVEAGIVRSSRRVTLG